MDEDESALEFGTNSGYVETIRQLAKEGKQEELSREVQAWVHDDWSWLHGGRTPHEAREKIAEQEFSKRMVLLERLVISLQPFLRQCPTAALWYVHDSLRSVQRDVSALQSDSNAVHDAVEQLRREVEALRMPAVQSHGNEEPQSPVCVAVAPSALGAALRKIYRWGALMLRRSAVPRANEHDVLGKQCADVRQHDPCWGCWTASRRQPKALDTQRVKAL